MLEVQVQQKTAPSLLNQGVLTALQANQARASQKLFLLPKVNHLVRDPRAIPNHHPTLVNLQKVQV